MRYSIFFLLLLMFVASSCKKDNVQKQDLDTADTTTSIILPQNGIIEFAGLKWKVKEKKEAEGINELFYATSSKNVFVDNNGHLHLLVTRQDDEWAGAELETVDSFDFGNFDFALLSAQNTIDSNTFVQFAVRRQGRNYSGMTEAGINIYGKPIFIETQHIEYYQYTTSHKFALIKNPVIDKDYKSNPTTHSITIKPDEIFYKSQSIDKVLSSYSAKKGKKVAMYSEDELVYSPTGAPLKIAIGFFLDNFEEKPKKDTAEIIIKDINFTPLQPVIAKSK
ncbi:MAG TPA: hypothetical protein PL149_01965 [Candidatus Kapabacteria bacterium]|nr:hypothetical protein [Candidatus Kapabacteria bacterium]